jgi:hypothetical protein
MRYKGKLIRSMHKWIGICKSRWLLIKSWINFWKRLRRKTLQLWYDFCKKQWIQEAGYFASGKTQGTINGGKRCRLMVGSSSRHCLARNWEGM